MNYYFFIATKSLNLNLFMKFDDKVKQTKTNQQKYISKKGQK